MEFGTVIGLLMGFGSLIVMLLMEGAHLGQLWAPSALVLIFFGSLGATMAGYPFHKFKKLPSLIIACFVPKQWNGQQLVDQICELTEKARREGLLHLESEVQQIAHPILRRGLTMLIDGTDPEQVRTHLNAQVGLELSRQKELAGILEQAGGYSPTIGIVGTVMGMVHVLSNMSDVDSLGPMIAVAFMATFYGIFFANLLWLPLANKLSVFANEEAALGTMIVEGIFNLHAGQNARTIRDNLIMYLPDSSSSKASGNAEAKAGEVES